MKTIRRACQHCHRQRVSKANKKGLCWTCYEDLAVRANAAPAGPRGKRLPAEPDLGLHRQVRMTVSRFLAHRRIARERMADRPTRCPPGSREKIEEMARRVQMGLSATHPKDLQRDLN